MAAAAVVGTLVAPIAAQAGTAASTAVVAPADFGTRTSTPVGNVNGAKGKRNLAVFLAGAAGVGLITWGVIEATKKDKSRGD